MGDKRDKRVKRKIWPTHIYDYNYKVSEGYYKPQKNFMETYSSIDRSRYSPPKHQSYAERFASNPWYGSAYGYPYRKDQAALNEPLLKPSERPVRTSSLVRDMKEQGERDIPLHIRASRRRKRFEEEDDLLGIRSLPSSRTNSRDRDEKVRLHPRFKDIGEKLRSLDAELIRLAPRRSSVTENSYTSPSGTTVTKSSHYESSTSSRPPISPRVRKTSFNEEFSQLPPRPRARISSVGEMQSFQRSSRRSSINEDEDLPVGPYSGRANKLREERRLKESREITEGIHTMIEKMRTNRYNPEHGYTDRQERGIRPSTLDPHLKEDKTYSSFAYGLSRKI